VDSASQAEKHLDDELEAERVEPPEVMKRMRKAVLDSERPFTEPRS